MMKEPGERRWRFQLSVALLLALSAHVNATKWKRQIFREQVLPALGGKIPEEAFRTDRLALNRLNKEGITIPDGIVFDARHVHKHPQRRPGMPELIKVYLMPDGRYVPPEGRYNYNHPNAIDTTYLIQTPFAVSSRRYESSRSYAVLQKPRTVNRYRSYVRPTSSPKPALYKPIITPLVLPADSHILDQSYFPAWNLDYHWTSPYEPFHHYYIKNIALFDSHQIITDYDGFLKEFHGRSSRHITTTGNSGHNVAMDKHSPSTKGIRNIKSSEDSRTEK